MFGMDPSMVLYELDITDLSALYWAGLRFEQRRTELMLSPMLDAAALQRQRPSSQPQRRQPPKQLTTSLEAKAGEYQAPDRASFYRTIGDMNG